MHGGRKREDRERLERLGVAFVVAILLHVAFIPMINHIIPETPANIPDPTEVEMVKLLPEQWENNMRPSDSSPAGLKEKEGVEAADEAASEAKERESHNQGQVVYIAPTGEEKAPENARFLAESNSKVDKETISKYRKLDYKNPLPVPMTDKEAKGADSKTRQFAMKVDQGARQKPGAGSIQDKSAGSGDKYILKIPDLKSRPKLNLPESGDETAMLSNSSRTEQMRGNSDMYELNLGGRNEKARKMGQEMSPGLAALMPGYSNPGKISGGPFAEHLENVEEGEGTFLNAREYKYAAFFNRIKREVGSRWDPSPQLMKRDPTGGIYGARDRLTVLRIVLDPQGNLKKADVEKQSGLDFLDAEAVAAFQRAQPFLNPPQGLLKEGEISFSFGFYIEFSSSSMKMFRF